MPTFAMRLWIPAVLAAGILPMLPGCHGDMEVRDDRPRYYERDRVVVQQPPPPQPVYVQQAPPPVVYAPPQPDVVVVREPPPPPRFERPGPPPGPGFVWVNGYYNHGPRGYVWVGGHYDRPPRPDAHWVDPGWDRHGAEFQFRVGGWR